MKSKVDKSLIEVWEMKDKVRQEFEESGYEYFTDYIKATINEMKQKYNLKIKYHIKVEDDSSK